MGPPSKDKNDWWRKKKAEKDRNGGSSKKGGPRVYLPPRIVGNGLLLLKPYHNLVGVYVTCKVTREIRARNQAFRLFRTVRDHYKLKAASWRPEDAPEVAIPEADDVAPDSESKQDEDTQDVLAEAAALLGEALVPDEKVDVVEDEKKKAEEAEKEKKRAEKKAAKEKKKAEKEREAEEKKKSSGDWDDEFAAERAELAKSKDDMFHCVPTNIAGSTFIAFREGAPDPVELITKVFEYAHSLGGELLGCGDILRLVPVEQTCFARPQYLKPMLKVLCGRFFSKRAEEGKDMTYCVHLNRRYTPPIEREEANTCIKEAMWESNKDNNVHPKLKWKGNSCEVNVEIAMKCVLVSCTDIRGWTKKFNLDGFCKGVIGGTIPPPPGSEVASSLPPPPSLTGAPAPSKRTPTPNASN